MDASKRHAKLQELYDLAQGSEEFEGGVDAVFANGRAQLEAVVEPRSDSSYQAHGGFAPFMFADGLPVVGISPPLMRSFPFSIR